jgi:hypothetical protein
VSTSTAKVDVQRRAAPGLVSTLPEGSSQRMSTTSRRRETTLPTPTTQSSSDSPAWIRTSCTVTPSAVTQRFDTVVARNAGCTTVTT